MTDPRAEYTRRIAHWDAEIARGDRKHLAISNGRLAAGIAAAVIGWFAYRDALSAWWLMAPLAAFIALVLLHDRVLKQVERSRRARRIYERGIERLDGTWAGSGANGARFLAEGPLGHDLDLFGPSSLFQLLNTTRTEVGEETLARWLLHGAAVPEILARQAAVAELAPLIDFRESLAVTAAEVHVGKTSALSRWVSARTPNTSTATRAVFSIITAISVALVAAIAMGFDGFPVRVLLFWLLLQIGITVLWMRRVAESLAAMDDAAGDLGLLKMLLERIENQPFQSPRLAAMRNGLPMEGRTASQTIRQLQRLVSALDSCRNQIFAPIAIFFQLPIHLLISIDGWRKSHGFAIAGWLATVGECEAFSALGTHAFEHPADPFPVIDPSTARFDAAGLAHPLIAPSVAVANDVSIGGDGPRVLMVSGSNMSGKSTLLRAIGVNVVLAMTGARVRAARLTMSPLVLGAALRIEDSLQDGQSRFYAEILRIRGVVELSKGSVPLLFMLDEILAGTNSFDRRIGAEAIIRSLVNAGAIGLVTTHDLALTELVSSLEAPAANVHFEDRIEDGKMVFDYRMRPGVVERSNALALMRAVGLDV
jgi:hypothetical protein